jgi:drug/metabolite transporter (DMT)-like permease
MLTVTIGLVGALLFGAADFLGGLAARRVSALRVTAVVAASGLVVLIAALTVVPGVWSPSALLLGGISGLTGALAISLLYRCLAIGPMSILSPTTAVVSALVPMLAGLVRGERFIVAGYLALGLALVAIVLVGFVPEKGAVRPSLTALAMAVGSGALMGTFMILIDLTPDDSGLVPLIANRAVNAGVMLLVLGVMAAAARRSQPVVVGVVGVGVSTGSTGEVSTGGVSTGSTGGVSTSSTGGAGMLIAIGAGAIDAIANVLLLVGLRMGELSVMSVLTALYPAGTIILAAVVLKERIARVQAVGLVLAILAASMLALT